MIPQHWQTHNDGFTMYRNCIEISFAFPYFSYLGIFLPPANEVWGKVMFYTCRSFCPQEAGGVFQHANPPGQIPPGRAPLAQTPPPRETSTEVGGMHPTGMHSCLNLFFWLRSLIVRMRKYHIHILLLIQCDRSLTGNYQLHLNDKWITSSHLWVFELTLWNITMTNRFTICVSRA